MQNRYIADIGDFGKYALLRNLLGTGLILGVNWYLTPNENHNFDGKYTSYLYNNKYRGYDDELYDILKYIVDNNKRNVLSIQKSAILPENTLFYDNILDLSKETNFSKRHILRQSWHNIAMEKLKNCEIIFLDPDNGLQVKSISLTGNKGNKYIGLNELKDYYKLGKSIVFYNHRERKAEEEYLNKFIEIQYEPEFKGAEWIVLKYLRGTIRDYIFILQPTHSYLVKIQLEKLLNSKWKDNFSLLNM